VTVNRDVRSILGILILACATVASAATPFTTYEAIEFASPDGAPLLMDLRVPQTSGLHPVILYLHSGAWVTGNRFGGPAVRQATRGYAVASIEYRLAPANIWPAQIEDAKAAVRWLRANAARFQLDPNRIAVFGTSAGGHIGAVLGTSGGVASLEGLALGNAQFSSRVQAVVDLYGPTDLLKLDEQKLPCIPLNGNAAYLPPSLLIGCPIQECQEKTRAANPMSYVTPDDPPFLIMHGLLDCLVPYKQSVDLQQSLEAAGVDSRLILIPNGEHGGRAFDDAKYTTMIDAFLDRTLRAPRAPRRRAVRR
jgi:acetyl esterase/lipase